MVLAIGVGMSEAQSQAWINTHGITHPVLADPGDTLYSLFGDGYVPYNAIIDGEVILRYGDSGYDEPAIIAMIDQLLAELLSINHVPLLDTEDDQNPYSTDCTITSNDDLILDELQLHWNLDGGGAFTDVVLTPVGGDAYTAEIPAQMYGTTVYYYLSAADTGGRNRTDPNDAPTALHSFYVGVDATPPVFVHEPLGDQVLVTWPPTISATVTDNQGLDTVTLEFMINGGQAETVPMTLQRNGVYAADLFGSIAVGDYVEYRMIAEDVAVTPNSATEPETGYHLFNIVQPIPVYIFQPSTMTSPNAFAQELDGLGIAYDRGAELPDNPSLYTSIFACLGIYSSNHVVTADQGQALAVFLDNGGHLYMEGGDTWAYDAATAVHPYFNINGLNDGAGDAGPIQGAVGTFTEGMYFTYSGANSYIDKIAPLAGAEAVFLNVTPAYINGVSNVGATYQTIGTSFEFGGLVDETEASTKADLLVEMLEFFEMNPLGILLEDGFESGDTSGWSMTMP